MDGLVLKTPDASQTPFISLFEDDDTRWAAVQTRNVNADGFFVYAVRTTKICCRPICKARLARRANVSFYDTVVDAQKAGFRPCKRCKPDAAGFMPEEAAVRKIREFVARDDLGDDGARVSMSLSQMAKKSGLSKWHFHRVFKTIVGVTPVEFVRLRKKATQAPLAVPLGDGTGTPDNATSTSASGSSWELVANDSDMPVDPNLPWADFLIWPEDEALGIPAWLDLQSENAFAGEAPPG